MTDTLEWLPIGKIVGAQGLRGDVKVYPLSQFPDRFEQPGQRWLSPPHRIAPQPINLLDGRPLAKKNLYVVRLEGVDDRTQAEAIRDYQLMVPASDRPVLAEGEFHYLDLVGLHVIDQTSQTVIGVVTDLLNSGNDLLEVELLPNHLPNHQTSESPNPTQHDKKVKAKKSQYKKSENVENRRRVLIPFVEAIVPIVNIEAKLIEITPPTGLLDL